MDRPPKPVDGKNAEEAEARLKRLHSRFRNVSSRLDGRSRRAGGWGLTVFEVVILIGVMGFIGWAVWQDVLRGHLFGSADTPHPSALHAATFSRKGRRESSAALNIQRHSRVKPEGDAELGMGLRSGAFADSTYDRRSAL